MHVRPPIVMFLAKTFQTDPRPKQEANSLIEAKYPVYVISWDRESKGPSNPDRDGAIVRSFRLLNVGASSGFGLALGAMFFQLLLIVECIRMIGRLKQRPILHVHDYNTLVPGCFLRALGLSRGLVYDCHELTYSAYSDLFNALLGAITRVTELRWSRAADLLITVSQPIAEYFRQYGIRAEVIYNCPRLSDIPRISKRDARNELGLPLDVFLVSYIGSIRYDSGLELLLKVAETAREGHEGIKFLVVGGGPLASAFKKAATSSRNRRLSFLPEVSRGRAMLYQVASDLTWAIYDADRASVNARIGMPWKMFESLACAVPILVRKGTYRSSLLETIGCGLIVEADRPEEIVRAISDLAGDTERYLDKSTRARQAAISRFNWDRMSERMLRLYDRLIANGHAHDSPIGG